MESLVIEKDGKFVFSSHKHSREEIVKEKAKYYWELIRGGHKQKFKIGDRVILDQYPCIVNKVEWRGDSKYVGYVYTVIGTDFGRKVKEEDLMFDPSKEETKSHNNMCKQLIDEMNPNVEVNVKTIPEPKFKVGDSVEVLKTGNTYTISQVKFNGKEFVYTLSTTDNSACWFSEEELKPIHFIDIAIKPHNVRGDEIIKMLEELGGTNAFSFDGSDHNCVNPFAYYIDNDDKQIYGGGIEFLRKNGYKIHALEELKKKEYPKTFEECVHVLEGENRMSLEQMNTFRKLIDARNAYWKIAGTEMGLGKPWEPDWTDLDQLKYCIWVDVGEFITMTNVRGQHILAFPTPEMRDAFYEAFKEEIEICKELL